jgi:hypothetical protein
VLGIQFARPAQYFGGDAGGSENVHEIFLFEFVRQHQFVQGLDGARGFQGVVPLFEVFNDESEQFGHAPFGRTHPASFSIQFFEDCDVPFVFRFASNDRGQNAA